MFFDVGFRKLSENSTHDKGAGPEGPTPLLK
jgi:hypothetical protein